MAFKWTKAARAKLSRSQRRDGRNENDSCVGSTLNAPPDSAIGVIKIGAPSLAAAGRGAYAICALPDLCLGVVSRRLCRLLRAC
jgi:hypothetical protein